MPPVWMADTVAEAAASAERAGDPPAGVDGKHHGDGCHAASLDGHPGGKARRSPACHLLSPHGAGGPAAFRDWPDLLPPDLEPLAVQLPGREARTDEPPVTSLDTAVTAIVDALAPALDRPYVLYGQSLGGAIAYASAVEISVPRSPST